MLSISFQLSIVVRRKKHVPLKFLSPVIAPVSFRKLVATAALGLAATCAHAADIASMPNQDGGLITLTDYVGTCVTGRRMYITNAAGRVLLGGCWAGKDPWLLVQYDYETDVRRYPEANFALTADGIALQRRMNAQ
jgi:hypothetical protein